MEPATIIALLGVLISLFALAVAGTTLWITLLNRGRLAMTPPTVVFFGYDFIPKVTPKVFLRTLLYSTSVHGQIVEGMYVKLLRNGNQQLFSFWGYGETKNLVAGSGLYVGQTGVEANHHFVLSVNQPNYEFTAGVYVIVVFAQLAGRPTPLELAKISITLSSAHVAVLAKKEGVLFEMAPDRQGYIGHARDGS